MLEHNCLFLESLISNTFDFFQSIAEVGTWGKNSLDNMKVMLVIKGRRPDSVGRAVADPPVF